MTTTRNRFTPTQVRLLAAVRYGRSPADMLDVYPEEICAQPPNAFALLNTRGLLDGWALTKRGREVCDWLFEADYDSPARPPNSHQPGCLRPLDAWILANGLLPEATQDLLRKRLRLMHMVFPKLKTDDVDGRAQAWLGVSARRRRTKKPDVARIVERKECVCEVCKNPFTKTGNSQVVCSAECRAVRRKAYDKMRKDAYRRRLQPVEGWQYGDTDDGFIDPYRQRIGPEKQKRRRRPRRGGGLVDPFGRPLS